LAGKARNVNPAIWYLHFYLAAAHVLTGCPESARAELGIAEGLQGTAFEGNVARLAGLFAPALEIRIRFEAIIRAGLSARLPEE
jgi:hypothetical protein